MVSMLTTTDNPWNPVTHYDEWNHYDCQVLGYNTNSLIARETDVISSESKESLDAEEIVEKAINKIIELHEYGLYKKVFQ